RREVPAPFSVGHRPLRGAAKRHALRHLHGPQRHDVRGPRKNAEPVTYRHVRLFFSRGARGGAARQVLRTERRHRGAHSQEREDPHLARQSRSRSRERWQWRFRYAGTDRFHRLRARPRLGRALRILGCPGGCKGGPAKTEWIATSIDTPRYPFYWDW